MSTTYKYMCCLSNLHDQAARGSPSIVILLCDSVRETHIYIMITALLVGPLL